MTHEPNEDIGFFQEFGDLVEECPPQPSSASSANTNQEQQCYQKATGKPKWWRTLAGRRGTKAQRRAMSCMSDYILKPVPFGTFVDWNTVFSSPAATEIWLEVGFGLGDNLLCNAQLHPEIFIVGADLHSPGVGTVLRRMQQGQKQGRYWNEYSLRTTENDPCSEQIGKSNSAIVRLPPRNEEGSLYSHVRIYHGNGMKFLHSVPVGSLSAVLLTFPDPWPNKLHAEYRFIQVSTAADIHRALQKRGRFYLATDDEGYFSWCRNVMEECHHLFTPVVPVPDRCNWLPAVSKYEQKGLDEGRRILLACWEVRAT
jgi:tRNA (guanine-N7-)-methyltransferase